MLEGMARARWSWALCAFRLPWHLTKTSLINSSLRAYCWIYRIILKDFRCWNGSMKFMLRLSISCRDYNVLLYLFLLVLGLNLLCCAAMETVIFNSSFNTLPTLKKTPQKLNTTTPNQTNQPTKNPPTLCHDIMGRFLHLRTLFFALQGIWQTILICFKPYNFIFLYLPVY